MSKPLINHSLEQRNIEEIYDVSISEYFFDKNENKQTQKQIIFADIKNQENPFFHSDIFDKLSVEQNLFKQCEDINFNQSLDMSSSEVNENIFTGKRQKQPSKNRLYAKNYRQKKKERLKILQEENRFLKTKIDDLSFRLKQTQLQLNKLKHNHPANTHTFQTTRGLLLKQSEKLIQKQESNIELLLQVKNKLKKLNAFDNKHKMDLLNYFMSQLLQNIINDFGFYFLDCLIQKKGFWKVKENIQFRRIDLQIREIVGQQNFKRMTTKLKTLPEFTLDHMRNFKNLWKNLYQDYINIVNQGLLIQTLCRPLQNQINNQICKQQVLNYFKLQLYFQKIKYRKDMRQLRESWFKEISQQNEQARSNRINGICKKIKLCSS